jgi:hypothetical protein
VTITPGPYSPVVTQWVKTGFTTDSKGNKVPAFTPRSIRALADGPPGRSSESDTAAGDVVTADRVLLFADWPAISEYDEFTASDGRRYKVGAVNPARHPATGTAVTQVNLQRIT